MIPPVYTLLSGSTSIAAIFGSAPCRIYPWGEAPQGVAYPYATWGTVDGTPENYLGQVPDIDSIRVQVDVWARTGDDCADGARAIRDELETACHMVSFGSMERDPDTKAYRMRMDFEFWTDR